MLLSTIWHDPRQQVSDLVIIEGTSSAVQCHDPSLSNAKAHQHNLSSCRGRRRRRRPSSRPQPLQRRGGRAQAGLGAVGGSVGHRGAVVSLDVALQVAPAVAGEGAVEARVRLDPRVDPQVAAERGAAGEVSAARLAQGGGVGGLAIIAAAHPS